MKDTKSANIFILFYDFVLLFNEQFNDSDGY